MLIQLGSLNTKLKNRSKFGDGQRVGDTSSALERTSCATQRLKIWRLRFFFKEGWVEKISRLRRGAEIKSSFFLVFLVRRLHFSYEKDVCSLSLSLSLALSLTLSLFLTYPPTYALHSLFLLSLSLTLSHTLTLFLSLSLSLSLFLLYFPLFILCF